MTSNNGILNSFLSVSLWKKIAYNSSCCPSAFVTTGMDLKIDGDTPLTQQKNKKRATKLDVRFLTFIYISSLLTAFHAAYFGIKQLVGI